MAKKDKEVEKVKKAKGETMNLQDFAAAIAEDYEGVNAATVKKILGSYFGSVQATILNDVLNPGDSISMPGFGKLVCLQKKPRNARNPKTGETFVVPARPAVRFKMAAHLRLWGKPKKEEKAAKKGDKDKKAKKK